MTDRTRRHLLHVDLTSGAVERQRVPDRWLAQYVGGKGLGARYLYEHQPPGTDPLGPDARLCFLVGPLTGRLPGDPRYAVVTRSPLTGAFLDSYSGGAFADALVGSLGDCLGVVVTGAADDPMVLELADGEATLSPAGSLWGRDVAETCDAFDAPTACIGPAGEHGVRYATVASEGGDHHAGRGGAGAVMGAKGLKAVVARGPSLDPSPELVALRERYEERYGDAEVGGWHAASGTLETVDFANEVGILPTRGWQEGSFDGSADIGIEAVDERAVARERADGIPGDFRVRTPEGDSLPRGATQTALGAGLGIDDFDVVATLGGVCDRLGLDVISTGSAVAWAIRARENGWLPVDGGDTASDPHVDADLSFGDGAAARRLIEAIARREGDLPDALADGVSTAAERFGGRELIPTVKSMEVPTYDPRGSPAMALAYATSDRGACHRRSLPAVSEVFAGREWNDADRVALVVSEQTVSSLLWSLIADDFAGALLADDLGAEWLDAVDFPTSTDPQDLRRTGERIWTLTRLFNLREGFEREDDSLPPAFETPLSGGPTDGRALDADWFERLLDRYYLARGWSRDGVPTRELLGELDLLDVVGDDTPLANDPTRDPAAKSAATGHDVDVRREN